MYKVFHYEDGTRACAAGQRRCAVTAMDLVLPGAEARKNALLDRAAKTAQRLKRGANVPKHDRLDYVVVDAFTKGTLPRYIHTEKGDYTLQTHNGRTYQNNIFKDHVERKSIFSP